jgi:hypothetical protein
MKNSKLPKVPEIASHSFQNICTILSEVCTEKLNPEYLTLSIELAAKLARKRPTPLLSGNIKTWAAGIIHALGTVNFLFDKSQLPHMTSKELCDWFSLGQSTISGKSKLIRDLFDMGHFDPTWCLPSKMMGNPLIWMVSIGGYIVDIRSAPYEVQVAAFEAGAIPFIPSANKDQ